MSFLIQFLFWGNFFAFIGKPTKATDQNQKEGVSIIICGKNESANISQNLPDVLNQSYPLFEVIFVNDHSDDDTIHLLKHLQQDFQWLKVIDLDSSQSGKKSAIQAGIRSARFDYILSTDADCKPISHRWINLMVEPLITGKEISLGFSPFYPGSSWIANFARYDNVLIFLLYGSLARIGFPYMGVGRNVAYRKYLFQDDLIKENQDLISGDDDLFINQISTANNTAVIFHPESLTFSHGKASLITFLKQKRRHVSTSWRYRLSHQLILLLFSSSHWFFYLGILIGFFGPWWWTGFILLFIRTGLILLRMRPIAHLLNGKDLYKWSIWFDFLYLFYYPVLSTMLYFKPPRKW